MQSFQLDNLETRPLTKQLADQFRDMDPAPTERQVNPARLKYLHEKVTHGLGIPFLWVTAKLGDKVYRINGQHSSKVLADLDGSFPDDLKVLLARYTVPDMEGLITLYRQFDDRKSGRSAADIACAYQGGWPELKDIPHPIAKMGIEGVSWHRRLVEGVPVPPGDEVYSLFQEQGLWPFLHWLGEVFTIKTPEMKRVQVVSAMHATFNASETESRTFWAAVARGGNEFEENAPATILDSWLKTLKENPPDNFKPGNLYQGCIYAWNAFRDGKAITTIKFDARKGFYRVSE